MKDLKPPLPAPDTHCFDDDTGKDVWSYSAAQLLAYRAEVIEMCVKVCEEENAANWSVTGQVAAKLRSLK